MKYIILSCFLTCLFLAEKAYTQVTISPEIGVSYLPFTLYPATLPEIKSNRVDFLLGISARLPIHEKGYVNMRLSYTDREDMDWPDSGFAGTTFKEYNHSDINMDFSVMYSINDFISLGGGPSAIRKINSTLSGKSDYWGGPNYSHLVNRFYFGVNSGISFDISRYSLKVMYTRIFGEQVWSILDRANRLDITFAVRVFGGK